MNLPARIPETERPRERLASQGACALHDSELLALILRTGVPGANALELARALMLRYGGLRGALAAPLPELRQVHGMGTAKACSLAAVLELARRAHIEPLRSRDLMSHPDAVRSYCIAALGHLEIELCMALFLDQRLHLIECCELARGTLNQAAIYPREVVREALRHHAAALILAHNHPSGAAQPSAADLALTRQLKQALALVDVRLVDHLIVARDHAVSLAERGQL
ncbi:MAG: DNA repair protein RadC [Bordetella sp.]|nr:DNA repair protein RadC [Bordetella sp.]